MKRNYVENKRVDPGEDYPYEFVITPSLTVYHRSKDGGGQKKADHVVMGSSDKPHSIRMHGPDGEAFVFDSDGIRRADNG